MKLAELRQLLTEAQCKYGNVDVIGIDDVYHDPCYEEVAGIKFEQKRGPKPDAVVIVLGRGE